MLSIGKCGAVMARNYYEQEKGYYTKQQSDSDTWQGKLCNRIGLKDGTKIQPEQFEAMLSQPGHKVAGFDLTFSADKSISIALQLSPKLEQEMLRAHREAVSETLKIIEKDIGTQVWDNTQKKPVHAHTGNLAVAKVEHLTSRAQDMDLHTHCVCLNMTELDGKIYALDAHKLYENKMRYGLEYRCRLAAKLQEQGYELQVTDAEKGLFELKGIRKDVRKYFSKRREDIENELQKEGRTDAKAADKATQKTRHTKEHIDLDAQRTKWHQELQTLKQEVPRKVSHQQISAEELKEQQHAALNRAAERLSEKQYAFTLPQLQRAVMQEGVLYGVNSKRAEALIRTDKNLIRLTPAEDSSLQGEYFTTTKNIMIAQGIEEMTAAGRGKFPVIRESTCMQALNDAALENNWKLGEQQEAVVKHIATSKDQFIAVRGLAGTGKTFTLNAAREVLERAGFEVRGMSATGQAADELKNDANLKDCGTIHHQLNVAEKAAGNAHPGIDYSTKKSWDFSGLKPSAKPTIWFCDEASLVDNNLFYHIEKMATLRGDKVVFVGDNRQMLPVGNGNSFSELVQRGQLATVNLDNIIRQKESPKLLKAVKEAVKGKTKISLNILSNDIREISARGHRLNAIAREYCTLSPEEQKETLVLTARNSDRISLNERIRARLIKSGQIQEGIEFQIQPDEKQPLEIRRFSKGDKIIFLRNDKKLDVMNGTKGIITGIDGSRITASIGENKTVTIDAKIYAAFDHGYAMTPNKAQGATVQRAIIHLSSKDATLNSKNSYYVDISRAKKNVKLFVDSREKLEPQISNFAKKITKKDFKPAVNVSTNHISFSGLNPKSARAFAHVSDKTRAAIQKISETPFSLLGMLPGIRIIATPLKNIARATGKVVATSARIGEKIAKSTVKLTKNLTENTNDNTKQAETIKGRRKTKK